MTTTASQLLIVGSCGRDTGGVAQYIRGQARQLDDDLDISIHDTISPPGKDALSEGGIAGYRWLLHAVLSALWTLLRYPFRSPSDFVHVHASSHLSFYRESAYVIYTAFVWKRPVVIHIHGSDFDSFLRTCGPIRSWYVRWILDLCTDVIVLSSYWEDVLREETGITHTTVLPNPIDAETFPPGDAGGGPHIVYIANLIERKGVSEFATAIDRLAAHDSVECTVSIAGSGPEADRIEALADSHAFVSYYGYVDEDRKRELLVEGSIYVLPTYAEGLPISLLEGMAGGNAIVSTTVGAIPEVVGEANGILISPVDVDELLGALETLTTDDERRRTMAETNSRLVREQYAWSHIADELLSLYHRLDSSPSAAPNSANSEVTSGVDNNS